MDLTRGGPMPGGTADGPVIVYDGVCNYCNAAVRFILRNDRTGRILFVPLQSSANKIQEHDHVEDRR